MHTHRIFTQNGRQDTWKTTNYICKDLFSFPQSLMDDFRQLELVTSGSMDGATQVLFLFFFVLWWWAFPIFNMDPVYRDMLRIDIFQVKAKI